MDHGMKSGAAIVLLLAVGTMMQDVNAGECTYAASSAKKSQVLYRFAGPGTRLVVNDSTAIGTVLWESAEVLADSAVLTNCPGRAGSAGLIDYWGQTTTVVAGMNVRTTNVTGIGYSISHGAFYPNGLRGYPDNPDGVAPSNGNNSRFARLRIVRIPGTMNAGTYKLDMRANAIPFTTWYVGTNRLKLADFYVDDITVTYRPQLTCRIVAPRQVKLPTIGQAALQSDGNTGKGPSQSFSIGLDNCNIPLSSASFSLSPVGGTSGGDCAATLVNNAVNGAQNVGVAIRSTTRASLCFRTSYPAARMLSTSAVLDDFEVYLRGLGGPIGAGKVDAAVTYTVEYQ